MVVNTDLCVQLISGINLDSDTFSISCLDANCSTSLVINLDGYGWLSLKKNLVHFVDVVIKKEKIMCYNSVRL